MGIFLPFKAKSASSYIPVVWKTPHLGNKTHGLFFIQDLGFFKHPKHHKNVPFLNIFRRGLSLIRGFFPPCSLPTFCRSSHPASFRKATCPAWPRTSSPASPTSLLTWWLSSRRYELFTSYWLFIILILIFFNFSKALQQKTKKQTNKRQQQQQKSPQRNHTKN